MPRSSATLCFSAKLGPAAKLCALALAAPLAQAGDLELSWSEGVLGDELVFELQGDRLQGVFVLPSLGVGPTPLALLDPLDPRSLDVGLDLLSLLQFGVLDGGGQAELSLPLPLASGLQGLTVYAQAFSVPGQPTLADELSNRISLKLSQPVTTHTGVGALHAARQFASATSVPEGVLLAGGLDPFGGPLLTSAELFDAGTQSFLNLAPLPTGLAHHQAVRLPDGDVLLVGGIDASGVSARVFRWDAHTQTFQAQPSLAQGRALHQATLLSDDRVLVSGGVSAFTSTHPLGFPASFAPGALLGSTEIYDPQTQSWSPGPALPAPLAAHRATTVLDGSTLLTGGLVPQQNDVLSTDQVVRFDPLQGVSVLPNSQLDAAVAFHQQTETAAGGLLATGGAVVGAQQSFTLVSHSTLYGPLTGFGPGPGPAPIRVCTDVVCVGGVDLPTVLFGPLYAVGAGMDSFSLATGTGTWSHDLWFTDSTFQSWSPMGSTTLEHGGLGMALADPDRILFVGGATTTAEIVVAY